MQPNAQFQNLDKIFWAHVRTLSESLGYTNRLTKQIKVYTFEDIIAALYQLNLNSDYLVSSDGTPSKMGHLIHSYIDYRANVLNTYVEPRLMDVIRAASVFDELQQKFQTSLNIPMNKQTGDKKKPAYLTAIVNMIIEANIGGLPCEYDPKRLTTVTQNGIPLRTLARRVDGCFPSTINPLAIWEIKEYYYTTTFGSRVAGGVYETLLDGLELQELRQTTGRHIQHLLIIAAYDTWWKLGRSYLCRMIDILHMGYVDEILFGYEVVERLPIIVQGWVRSTRP